MRITIKHMFFSSSKGVVESSLASATFSITPDSPVNED